MKCPFDGGALYPWGKPPRHYPWFCPNNDEHGGNGRFFTSEELEALYKVDDLIKDALPQILNGTLSAEDAVTVISRRADKPAPMVRARLAYALKAARNFKDHKTATTGNPKPVSATLDSPKPPKGSMMEPSLFMAVLQESGLSKKEAAIAIGRSVSRVHELTVSKGGSAQLLESFKQKLSEYKK